MVKENDAKAENDAKSKLGFLSKFKLKKKDKPKEEHEDQIARYTLLDVVKHPKLRLYAIIMCLLWSVFILI